MHTIAAMIFFLICLEMLKKKIGETPSSKTCTIAFKSNSALHNTIGKRHLSSLLFYSSGRETSINS